VQAEPGATASVAGQLCQQDQEGHPHSRMQRHRGSILAGQITGDEFLDDHFAQLDIRVPAHAGARQLSVSVFRTFHVVEGSLGNQLADRRYQGFSDFLVHEGFRLKDSQ